VVNLFGGQSLTGSLTELNASTGALSRVINNPPNELGRYDAVVAGGDSLYLVNGIGQVVQVNPSTGKVVRRLSSPNEPFAGLIMGVALKEGDHL
jgi:hypothetical protein